ncbi:dolichol-phosphate mannosyltransferase subunit 3, partial [Lipomyces starkeyi]
MTRLQKTVYVVVTVIAAYIILNLGIILLSTTAQTRILPVLPWLALVSLALASVGWAVYTTNDRPEAYKGPVKDVPTLKREFSQRGVEVDSRVASVFEEPGIA